MEIKKEGINKKIIEIIIEVTEKMKKKNNLIFITSSNLDEEDSRLHIYHTINSIHKKGKWILKIEEEYKNTYKSGIFICKIDKQKI
uniref:Uncharacterized protein n=1 Tax=Meloidogyne hapla TaxID=6305 RepID=A0A1I8BC56_MELHA